MGTGALGGKANGLLLLQEVVRALPSAAPLAVDVPAFSVVGTDVFDEFLDRGGLRPLTADPPSDRALALAFQEVPLPPAVSGAVWALAAGASTPLAVRSSSVLEDALGASYAGVYLTKMLPGHEPEPERRFRLLAQAIRLVWASTFFESARRARAACRAGDDEKMAVVVQEVVGRRHAERFYPDVSGVARSLNFYAMGRTRPGDGVADLALGLGKTIVEGGRCWTYAPAWPRLGPPHASPAARADATQRDFWAVRLSAPPVYDPVAEAEFLVRPGLAEAALDGSLHHVASTYLPSEDRIVPGLREGGTPVVDFAPLLEHDELGLNASVRRLLAACAERLEGPVEIEIAATLSRRAARLAALQVRRMPGLRGEASLDDPAPGDPTVLVDCRRAGGHGAWSGLRDVVYVERRGFSASATPRVAAEVAAADGTLRERGRPYLLIGFGRWGSSEPWLGIPVAWSQISGAQVVVEATLPQMDVEPSQGAHFFHNLVGLGVPYLCVSHAGPDHVDWRWLEAQPFHAFGAHVRHVELDAPLTVQVDGRRGRAVVRRGRA